MKEALKDLKSAEEQIKSIDDFLKEFKPKIKTSSDRVWYNLLSRSLTEIMVNAHSYYSEMKHSV